MAKPSLGQIRAARDYATVYQWNLRFDSFPSALAGPPALEDLNIRCESTTVPKRTNEPIIIGLRGHKTKQPGITTVEGQITLVFIDTVNNIVNDFLSKWHKIVTDPITGAHNLASDVEAEVTIERLDRQDNAIYRYSMPCWLEDFEYSPLDGQTSDAFKPTLILSYDFFDDEPV